MKKLLFIFLLLIVIFGAIIRAIVAGNVGPSADEIVYGTHAIDMIKSRAIGKNQGQSRIKNRRLPLKSGGLFRCGPARSPGTFLSACISEFCPRRSWGIR